MDWDAYLNLQYQLLLMKTRIMQIYGSAGQGFDATGLVLPNLYAGMGTFAAGVPDAGSIAAFHAAQAQNLLSQAASASGPVGLPVLNVATFLEALREEKDKEERQRSADNAGKQHSNSGVPISTSVGTATCASANPSVSTSASSPTGSHSSSNSKKEKKKKKKERKEARRAERERADRERERQVGVRETRASKKEVLATPTSTASSSQPRSSPSAAASPRNDKADTHHGIDLLAALAEQAEQQRNDRDSPPAAAAAPNTRPSAGGSEQHVAAEAEKMEEEDGDEEGTQGRGHTKDTSSTDHAADSSCSGKRRLRSSGHQQHRTSSSAQSEDLSDQSIEPSPAGSPTQVRRSGRSRKTKSFENVEEGRDAAAAANKKRRTTPAEQESNPDGGPMTSGAKKGEESRHGVAVTAMDLETTHEAAQRQREEVSTRHAVTLSAVKLEPEPELLAGPEPTTKMLVTARNPAYTMEPRQVVVIGAGIAGISAAIQLQHAGYRVTILEARERAGGRIKTMKKEMKGSKSSHLSIAIELGASFIKGAEGNPIARLCESLGLHTQQVPAERCLLFDHSGRTVLKHVEQQAQSRFHAMLGHAHAARHMRKRRDEERQECEAEQEKMKKAAAADKGSASRKPNKGGRKDALKISTSASASSAARKRDKGGKSRKGKGAAPSKGSSADDDDEEGDREAEDDDDDEKKQKEEEEEEEDDEEERLARARKALLDELVAGFDDTTTLQEAMDKIAELRASLPPASSTATAADDALAQPSPGPERDRAEAELEARVVDWHAAMLEGCVGAPLSRLSLFHWDQENATQYQGPHSLVKEGHAALIDELVARGKLDLRLNHVVESVDYSDDGGLVKLGTNQGAFEADLVVCTLPLGVLKQGAVQFVPPLPEEKRRSIERLGCGTFNVVVLFFSTIFWDKQTFWLGRAGEQQGRSYLYLSMTKVFGYPVLVAYQSGLAAEKAEAQEDGEVVDEALAFLHTVYKHSAKPLKSIVTRWTSDPYSGGAHSYIPPGATGADYDVLAAPVAARLFFAGEATNRRHPSSVAGAYVSGKREAERITALYGVVPVGDRPTASEPGPGQAEPIDLNHLDKAVAAAAPSPAPTPTPASGARQARPAEEVRSVKAEPEERKAEKKRKAGEEGRPTADDDDDKEQQEEVNSDKSPLMSLGLDVAPTTTTTATGAAMATAGKRRRIAKRKRRDGGAKSLSPELSDSPQFGDRSPAGGVATITSEDEAAAQSTVVSGEKNDGEHIGAAARSGRRTRAIPAEDDNDGE